jgi:hypothetical protein
VDDDNHCDVHPDGRFRITVLRVKPRVVQVCYGTIWGSVQAGDIEFLRGTVLGTVDGIETSQSSNMR